MIQNTVKTGQLIRIFDFNLLNPSYFYFIIIIIEFIHTDIYIIYM